MWGATVNSRYINRASLWLATLSLAVGMRGLVG